MNPWDFSEARAAVYRASQAQLEQQSQVGEAMEGLARSEAAYRVELAKEMLRLRAEGQPATLVGDLARGNERIAQLKLERDLAVGLVETAKQAGWRVNNDRKDAQSLLRWSLEVSTGRAAE